MNIPTIETTRLRLVPPTARHFDAFAAVWADPQFCVHMEVEPRSREVSYRSFCALLGHWQLREWGAFLVEERATAALVGCVGLSDWEGWPEPEIGWWTVPAHWGHGYATEAAAAALGYYTSLKRTSRLVSFVPANNARSIRVAHKLGAVYERDLDLNGHAVGVYVHAL